MCFPIYFYNPISKNKIKLHISTMYKSFNFYIKLTDHIENNYSRN